MQILFFWSVVNKMAVIFCNYQNNYLFCWFGIWRLVETFEDNKGCFVCLFHDMRVALYLFQNLYFHIAHCLLVLASILFGFELCCHYNQSHRGMSYLPSFRRTNVTMFADANFLMILDKTFQPIQMKLYGQSKLFIQVL